jgi:cell division protein FtsQ
VAAVALLTAAVGLLYVAGRETSMFALRDVVVQGAPRPVAAEVRAALKPLVGRSLVALSPGEAARLVRQLPTIVSASADRDYPHTLRVTVRPERPIAVVRHLGDSWLVSARGRLMQRLTAEAFPRLPRIWLGQAVTGLAPGSVLLPDEGGLAVRTLAQLPRPFPVPVQSAGGTPDAVTVVLRDGIELRLGEAEQLRLKLRVAAAVLRSIPASERAALAYVDVSLPARPVSAQKSQVVSSA